MSETHYSGVPDEAPTTEAAGDYQHVEATPADFGAEAGEGAEAFGAGLMKTAQFYGQVAANNGTNNFLDKRNAILYGDPHQGPATGPDGKPLLAPDGSPAYNGGFFGLRGAAALNAQASTIDQLNDAIAQERANLPTPRSRQEFDIDTRRFRAQSQAEMGQHADAQLKAWTTDVYKTAEMHGLNEVSRAATNDVASAIAGQDVINARVAAAKVNGLDPEGAALTAGQDVARTRIRTLMVSNPERANQVFEDAKGILGSAPDFDQLGRQVKQASAEFEMPGFVAGQLSTAMGEASSQAGFQGAPAAVPTGGIYHQIADIAGKHGATASEITALQRTASIESSGNPGAPDGGLFQLRGQKAAGIDTSSVDAQVGRELGIVREGLALQKANGLQPSYADAYLIHQQGTAGGIALLKAPPGANAIDVLTPAYRGNRAVATEAIVKNGGTPDMTAGDFVQHWRDTWASRGGAVAPRPGGQYPTPQDALLANRANNIERATQAAQQQFPLHPDVAQRAVDEYTRRYDQQISQLDGNRRVAADQVHAAMASDNPPISEDDLRQRGLGPAVDTLKQDGYAWAGVEKAFDENARGRALVYGSEFHDYFDRVTAPTGDPNQITQNTDLYHAMGPSPTSPLTNTGAYKLADLIALRKTPQGEASLASIKRFGDAMHDQLTFSNPDAGVFDQKGEVQYTRFMASVMPQLEAAAKAGPQALSKLLDPNSADYLGKTSVTFQRSDAEKLVDQTQYTVSTSVVQGVQSLTRETAGMNDAQVVAWAKARIAAGAISQPVWNAFVASRRAATGVAAPLPLEAPPPGTH